MAEKDHKLPWHKLGQFNPVTFPASVKTTPPLQLYCLSGSTYVTVNISCNSAQIFLIMITLSRALSVSFWKTSMKVPVSMIC